MNKKGNSCVIAKAYPKRKYPKKNVVDQIYDWSIGHEYIFPEQGFMFLATIGDAKQLREEYNITSIEFTDGETTMRVDLKYEREAVEREFVYCV